MSRRRLAAISGDDYHLIGWLRERWIGIGRASGPAARDQAEEGLQRIYRAVGRARPQITWCDSPLAGVKVAAALAERAAPLAPNRGGKTWAALDVRRELTEILRLPIDRHIWAGLGQPVHSSLRRSAIEAQSRRLRSIDEHRDRCRSGVRLSAITTQLARARHGQHDAGRLAFADFFVRLGPAAGDEQLIGAIAVAQAAGWWWPFTESVIISERPRDAHFDEHGRLHRATGPALVWPDGAAVFAWRGIAVPVRVIMRPKALEADEIVREPNAELRRVMIEQYGEERFLRAVGAEVTSEDDCGRLWQIPPTDSTAASVCLVQVLDATPGVAGVRKQYFLRVPPGCKESTEAVAWTFGMNVDEYRPEIET